VRHKSEVHLFAPLLRDGLYGSGEVVGLEGWSDRLREESGLPSQRGWETVLHHISVMHRLDDAEVLPGESEVGGWDCQLLA
jgi:hypothetical protein